MKLLSAPTARFRDEDHIYLKLKLPSDGGEFMKVTF